MSCVTYRLINFFFWRFYKLFFLPFLKKIILLKKWEERFGRQIGESVSWESKGCHCQLVEMFCCLGDMRFKALDKRMTTTIVHFFEERELKRVYIRLKRIIKRKLIHNIAEWTGMRELISFLLLISSKKTSFHFFVFAMRSALIRFRTHVKERRNYFRPAHDSFST